MDDTSTNAGTVTFAWRDDIEEVCRTDLVTAAQLPAPVVNYIASTKIHSSSAVAKVVLCVSIVGILTELALMSGFVYYRKTEVIRAAAFVPSMLILMGKMSIGNIVDWSSHFEVHDVRGRVRVDFNDHAHQLQWATR